MSLLLRQRALGVKYIITLVRARISLPPPREAEVSLLAVAGVPSVPCAGLVDVATSNLERTQPRPAHGVRGLPRRVGLPSRPTLQSPEGACGNEPVAQATGSFNHNEPR